MKRKQNKYTIKQQREAVALYRGGLGLGQVRARTGVPLATLHGWMRAAGCLRTQQEGARLAGDRLRLRAGDRQRAAVMLYEECGLSASQVAAAMGLTEETARRWIERFGRVRTIAEAQRRRMNDPANPVAARRIARIQEACRRVMDGEDPADVAAAVGVHPKTVRAWLRSEHNPYRTDRANGRRAA